MGEGAMEDDEIAGPVHAFLTLRGLDGSGRSFPEVLAFDDAHLEGVHDFIQWLFPLREASRAVPGAPVLGAAEAAAIRRDVWAQDNLIAARARMLFFYGQTRDGCGPTTTTTCASPAS